MQRKGKRHPSAPMSLQEAIRYDPVAAYGYECKIDDDGRDCVARNEDCPHKYCPASTRAFIALMAKRYG